jgi:hypothetical protein
VKNHEDLRIRVEQEFRGHFPVYFEPSPEKGIDALLIIEVSSESEILSVQSRAAAICSTFHDETGRLIVPIASVEYYIAGGKP